MKDRLKPEFIAPAVLYLCSEGNEDTGSIIAAGMGVYSRAAVVSANGVPVGDGLTAPTLEEIHREWDRIDDLSGAVEFRNAMGQLGVMLEPPKKGEAPAKEEPKKEEGATVATVFDRMPEAFVADKAGGVDVVFQYGIGGDDGGQWYVTIKDLKCEVAAGTHDQPTTTILMGSDDFLSLIKGELNAMKAFTMGKLKIKGDIMKSQLIEKLFKL